jgi:hypothetical protein
MRRFILSLFVMPDEVFIELNAHGREGGNLGNDVDGKRDCHIELPSFGELSVALTRQLPRERPSSPALAAATPAPDAKIYFDRGMESLGRKDYDNAIRDFDEAIRLDRNYAPAYHNRGWAY